MIQWLLGLADDARFWIIDRTTPIFWVGRMLGGDPPIPWRTLRAIRRSD